MDKRKIRDSLRLAGALLFFWLYIPHLLIYAIGGGKKLIKSDLRKINEQVSVRLNGFFSLLYHLHNNRYYRSLFYYRIGPVFALLISWYRTGDKYFNISATTKIGGGFLIAHPYSTIINAERIGVNFSCIHCTTLGATHKGRPFIGDNVSLGANVTIIGPVNVGSNVIIGAGSVVVKDIPDNSVAVGNPARVIKKLQSE